LAADRGEVEIFDWPLHKMDKQAVTRFRAANIGFIFQQYNLIPMLNCIENVSVPLRTKARKSLLPRGRRRRCLKPSVSEIPAVASKVNQPKQPKQLAQAKGNL